MRSSSGGSGILKAGGDGRSRGRLRGLAIRSFNFTYAHFRRALRAVQRVVPTIVEVPRALLDFGPPDMERIPSEVLYSNVWGLRRLGIAEKRQTLKRWKRSFFFEDIVIPEVGNGVWLFFRSMSREDYKAIFRAISKVAEDCLPEAEIVVIEDFKRSRSVWRSNLDARRFMHRNRHLRRQIVATCPVERECLFIRACGYSYIVSHFARCRPKVAVFFADMQPVEHLLSLHFRSLGVTTVTLQHGLYVDYGDFDTVNSINYLHQPSEYFLSWGRNTSDLIRRHHPGAKVIECGKPLIFAATSEEGTLPVPYVAVLLDQKIFHEQNREMLRIVLRYAGEKGYAVTVRLHPQLSREELFAEFPEVSERLAFADAEFVVGHTSTMIYEAIHLGCRTVRYRSAAPAIPLPPSYEFSSLDELKSCLSQPMPEGLGESFFCAVGEDALENYRGFFLRLERGEPIET